jgi:hypothetical protein
MSIQNVRTALVKAFNLGAFFSADNVAWENLNFRPLQSTPWAQFNFVPNPLDGGSLGGNDGFDILTGFLQVDLNYPIGSGSGEAFEKAEAIRSAFKAGQSFVESSQYVTITNSGISPGRIFSGFYRVSVTINFSANIQRS